MDIKSKNSRKSGIITAVVLLCICSVIMLSQYEGAAAGMESITADEVSRTDVLGSLSYDLAEGVYLLGNEYTGETDLSEVRALYGQRDFELTKRYLDYAVFTGKTENDEPEMLLANVPEEQAEKMRADDEDTAGYVFRAQYTFTGSGELSDVYVDGAGLEPEEEYELQSQLLASAQSVELDDMISSIMEPENITVFYGMTQDNLDALTMVYADEIKDTRAGVEAYDYYREARNTLCWIVALVALLLPVRKKLDISDMKIFQAPFEVPVLVWLIIYALQLDGIPGRVAEQTINMTLLPGMSMGNGIELIAYVFNFVMWFAVFGLLFWGVTCLRAMVRMKGAYWRDRTLTMKLIRHYRGNGTESDEEMVRLAGGVIRRIKRFLAKQYDALQHLDFRDKTNRTILKIVIINYIILALVCFLWYYGTLALILYSVLLFLFLRKYVRDLQEKYKLLLKSTNQLAEGHLDVPIEGDIGLFNPIQDELKKIQKGFKKAVEEEVKNERMKTELVTNVSHDLRTPLTAIITYVDLLKNEKDGEKRKEYIDVLERKSLRLKVLIEDLFEISKAASKSVVMHFMKVDIVELIKQAGLDCDTKIKDAQLEFRWKLPEHKVVMWLDSQKTYRILENLIVNITKYAMPRTRVYIEMTERESEVHISMKNVSATELDFDTEEITDRFVRGDSARNTEGSGLGLAIAKSFTELQHGTLKISTEADLFKADITLPKLEMPEEEQSVPNEE